MIVSVRGWATKSSKDIEMHSIAYLMNTVGFCFFLSSFFLRVIVCSLAFEPPSVSPCCLSGEYMGEVGTTCRRQSHKCRETVPNWKDHLLLFTPGVFSANRFSCGGMCRDGPAEPYLMFSSPAVITKSLAAAVVCRGSWNSPCVLDRYGFKWL